MFDEIIVRARRRIRGLIVCHGSLFLIFMVIALWPDRPGCRGDHYADMFFTFIATLHASKAFDYIKQLNHLK